MQIHMNMNIKIYIYTYFIYIICCRPICLVYISCIQFLLPISVQVVLPTVTSGEWKMTKAEGALGFHRAEGARGPENGWTCKPLKIKGWEPKDYTHLKRNIT